MLTKEKTGYSDALKIIEDARKQSEAVIDLRMKIAEDEAAAFGANCSSDIDLTNEAIKASSVGAIF